MSGGFDGIHPSDPDCGWIRPRRKQMPNKWLVFEPGRKGQWTTEVSESVGIRTPVKEERY